MSGVGFSDIAKRMRAEIKGQDVKRKDVLYKNVFSGSCLCEWLVSTGYAADSAAALVLGHKLKAQGVFEHLFDKDRKLENSDYEFYSFCDPSAARYNSLTKEALPSKTRLIEISAALRIGLETRDRTHHLRKYKACFSGAEAVQFLIDKGYASSHAHAFLICRSLYDLGAIAHYRDPERSAHTFQDRKDKYYIFGTSVVIDSPRGESESVLTRDSSRARVPSHEDDSPSMPPTPVEESSPTAFSSIPEEERTRSGTPGGESPVKERARDGSKESEGGSPVPPLVIPGSEEERGLPPSISIINPIGKQLNFDDDDQDLDLPPIVDVDEVLAELRSHQNFDYLRVAANRELQHIFAEQAKQSKKFEETVQFSDQVLKINRKHKQQTRDLIISNRAIYNFAPESYSSPKRRILMQDLKGLVLSLSSNELVLRVAGQYDYRLLIKHRTEALTMIARYYEEAMAQKIPVELSAEEDLRTHVFTKTMKKKHPEIRSSSPSHAQQMSDERPSSPSIFNPPSPVGAEKKPTESLDRREGWINKKKGQSEKWERKYCVMNGFFVEYFTPKIKGVEPLGAAEDVIVEVPPAESQDDVIESLLKSQEGKKMTKKALQWLGVDTNFMRYRASVTTKTRKKPLEIAAPSKKELERWIEAFRSNKKDLYLEGWLMKKDPSGGEDRKAWRRRYFVITKGRCWYYEMILKGKVDLRGGVSAHASKVQPTDPRGRSEFAGAPPKSRFAYRWNITDSQRIFHLAADTKEEVDDWVKAVSASARKYVDHPVLEDAPSGPILPEEVREAIEQEAPTGKVTFVFTDVQGSTTLWEKVPEAMDLSLEQHDKILRRLLVKYKGYEVKTEGDAFMVTFFSILDAILWCMAVQEALCANDWCPEISEQKAAGRETFKEESGAEKVIFHGLRIRMGIHTGEPDCRRNPVTGRMDYFGSTVNQSARVSDAAHGGQVVCTDEVFTVFKDEKVLADERIKEIGGLPALKDTGLHRLKGIKHKVRIYELLPQSLAARSAFFPLLRSLDNEEKAEKEKEKEKEEGDEDKKEDDESDEDGEDLQLDQLRQRRGQQQEDICSDEDDEPYTTHAPATSAPEIKQVKEPERKTLAAAYTAHIKSPGPGSGQLSVLPPSISASPLPSLTPLRVTSQRSEGVIPVLSSPGSVGLNFSDLPTPVSSTKSSRGLSADKAPAVIRPQSYSIDSPRNRTTTPLQHHRPKARIAHQPVDALPSHHEGPAIFNPFA